ncbi:hypothetical protein [Methanobrevibacter sp.]
MAQEYDKLFKLVALVFINAIMRILGLKPGIVGMEFPEVFSQDLERGIMDFPVLTKMGYYIIFEFHSSPLDEAKLLRNFQYLANFRVRVKFPVAMHIMSTEKIKKSLKSIAITPDWDFAPDFHFTIDLNGDEILNSIKSKIENNIDITDDDAYLFSILPFTKHEKYTVDWICELCYFINEVEISEEHKYIIKLCQILWVHALIKDKNLSEELIDVIKMRSNFIQEYERNLVESAVDDTISATAELIFNNKDNSKKLTSQDMHIRDVILKTVGIDIFKK